MRTSKQLKSDVRFARRIAQLISAHLSDDEFARLLAMLDGSDLIEDAIEKVGFWRCPHVYVRGNRKAVKREPVKAMGKEE
jgi:hypothetical protein